MRNFKIYFSSANNPTDEHRQTEKLTYITSKKRQNCIAKACYLKNQL
jgi:hypothetical protein